MVPVSRQYIYELFTFKQHKFLNFLRILFSIVFWSLWKLMFYFFALFYYISKSLKIDCCKLWFAASYFWPCPKSFFKAYKHRFPDKWRTNHWLWYKSCFYIFMMNILKYCNKIKQYISDKYIYTHIYTYIYIYIYIYIYLHIYIHVWKITYKS